MLFLNAQGCAVRTDGDRIVEVGNLTPRQGEAKFEASEVWPGLWDTHIHLLYWARSRKQLDLTGCPSREALLQAVRDWPLEWIVGGGWSEAEWEDGRWPNLQELDAAANGRPLILSRTDLHSALVNSAAILGLDVRQDPPGGRYGRDERGEFAGAVYDLALHTVFERIPPMAPEVVREALHQAVHQLHRWGITGVCDQRVKDGDDLQQALPLYHGLPLRIHCNLAAHHMAQAEALGLRFGFGDDWIRFGHVKFFSDGSLGSRTARFHEPYRGTDERGLWLTPPEELRSGFAEAHRLGFPVSVHAIGDEAVETVLDVFEEVGTLPLDRIEHVQYLPVRSRTRLARLGITASMQPIHLLDDRNTSERLVGERSADYYPLQSLLAAGTRLSFGSDAPVATPDPWLGLRAATRRARADEPPWYAAECIDRESALRAYTVDAAQSLGWNGWGELKPGDRADLVLVDGENAVATFVGGQQVY